MAVHDQNSQSQEDEIGLGRKKENKKAVRFNPGRSSKSESRTCEDENDRPDKAKDEIVVGPEPAVI